MDRSLTSGRIACDIKISAKELIRCKSYDLTALSEHVLHRQRKELPNEQVKNMYTSVALQVVFRASLWQCVLVRGAVTENLCFLLLATHFFTHLDRLRQSVTESQRIFQPQWLPPPPACLVDSNHDCYCCQIVQTRRLSPPSWGNKLRSESPEIIHPLLWRLFWGVVQVHVKPRSLFWLDVLLYCWKIAHCSFLFCFEQNVGESTVVGWTRIDRRTTGAGHNLRTQCPPSGPANNQHCWYDERWIGYRCCSITCFFIFVQTVAL